jgi:hypothetical protein
MIEPRVIDNLVTGLSVMFGFLFGSGFGFLPLMLAYDRGDPE